MDLLGIPVSDNHLAVHFFSHNRIRYVEYWLSVPSTWICILEHISEFCRRPSSAEGCTVRKAAALDADCRWVRQLAVRVYKWVNKVEHKPVVVSRAMRRDLSELVELVEDTYQDSTSEWDNTWVDNQDTEDMDYTANNHHHLSYLPNF